MNQIAAVRYDGISSIPKQVTLTFHLDGSVQVSGSDLLINYVKDDVDIPSQIGSVHARLRFADGSLCEISDYRALQQALPDMHKKGFIHRWEGSFKYALMALIVTVFFAWAGVEFALPVAAKTVANEIPLEWETAMGEQALAGFEKVGLMTASKLPIDRQAALSKKFRHALEKASAEPIPRIEFRDSEVLEANALALPSGIIIFTDDMVNFAEDDRELLGILGHEYGHVKHRHAMRHVLQNSVLALFIIMVTGDVGSLSAIATTMPVILAQAKFSRQFETEADDFSVSFMQAQGLDTSYMANILKRLGEKYGDSETTGYLDSHPATAERIKTLKSF